MSSPELLGQLYAASVVNTLREPLLLLSADMQVVIANAAFCNTFRRSRHEIEGRLLYEINDGEWNIPELRRLLEEVLPEARELRDFEIAQRAPDVIGRTILLNARQLEHPDGRVRLRTQRRAVRQTRESSEAVPVDHAMRPRRLEDVTVQHGVLEPGIELIRNPFQPDQLLARVREVLHGA